MIFFLNKMRLVHIRDEVAMEIKRASEWACLRILIWSIKQSMEWLSVQSLRHKYVPSFRQNAFMHR